MLFVRTITAGLALAVSAAWATSSSKPVEKRDATTSLISTINQLTALANQSDAIDKRVNLMTAATQGRMIPEVVDSITNRVESSDSESMNMQAATIDADGSQDVAAAVGDFGETMESLLKTIASKQRLAAMSHYFRDIQQSLTKAHDALEPFSEAVVEMLDNSVQPDVQSTFDGIQSGLLSTSQVFNKKYNYNYSD